MAQRDASKVQLDFPQLTADLIAALRLTGTLGLLELSDRVVPVVNVANIRPTPVIVAPVDYDSGEIFNGRLLNPGANTIVLDSGPLAAGTYDVIIGSHNVIVAATVSIEFQWRNALNAANLTVWPMIGSNVTFMHNMLPIGPFGINIGLNERIRLVNIEAFTGRLSGFLMIALRPTP